MIISKSFQINGSSQWLYLNLCLNPKGTLLFIHGGPGWADSPWAGVICKRIWGEFNTVHWDQRGCNRSFDMNLSDHSSLTIHQMVQDGLEVCRLIGEEFRIHRPVLIGHSWGAFLSVLMAFQAPELFHSYIGIGQLISNHESEPLSLKLSREQARKLGREDLLAELNKMPENFYKSVPLLFRQREIISKLGGEFKQNIDNKALENWILTSPKEYQSNWETLNISCERSCLSLWPELIERNLFEEVSRLNLPVTLIQGQQDYFTPLDPAVQWLNSLECSGQKELIEFDQSAHWPQIEENEKFSNLLFNKFP
jgi:pimeloyl-ACP methyl ester carboxylesterase